MKARIWGLVAFNVAAMCAIARVANFASTVVLVVILFFANILISFVFRRSLSGRTNASSRALVMLHSASLTDYIPLLGGAVCVFIGLIELTWKPCVIGVVAIAIGVLRLWSKK
jgi:hypothetical protein